LSAASISPTSGFAMALAPVFLFSLQLRGTHDCR
jgi:hypothetical protein